MTSGVNKTEVSTEVETKTKPRQRIFETKTLTDDAIAKRWQEKLTT